MALFRQLGLLLWKNFTLRRRQPLRVAVEFVWPLVLFFILMAVRLKDHNSDLVKPKPECHHFPQALPSAGTLAFLQSYICNLNDECLTEEDLKIRGKDGANIGSNFKDSVMSKVMSASDAVLSSGVSTEDLVSLGEDLIWIVNKGIALTGKNGVTTLDLSDLATPHMTEALTGLDVGLSTEAVDALMGASPDLQGMLTTMNSASLKDLAAVLEFMTALSSQDTPAISQQQTDLVRRLLCDDKLLTDYLVFKNPGSVTLVAEEVCDLSDSELVEMVEVVAEGVNRTIVQKEIVSALGGLGTVDTISTVFKIMNDVSILNKLKKAVESVQAIGWDSTPGGTSSIPQQMGWLMCGRNNDAFKITARLGGLVKERMVSAESKQDSRSNSFDPRFKNIKDNIEKKRLDQTCAELFAEMDSSPFTRILWRELKPIVLGVITYAPDTPLTRQIIKETATTFDYLETLTKIMMKARESLPAMGTILRNNVEPLKRFLISPQCPVLVDLVQSPSIKGFLPTGFSNILGPLKLMTSNPCEYLGSMLPQVTSLDGGPSLHQWEEVLGMMQGFLGQVTPYLKCFRLQNKFVGYKNLTELEEKSLVLIGNKTLLAALAFDNISPKDTEMPTVVKYRIRMDYDRVESTSSVRDTYIRPGPEFRHKTFTYWFIDIQDMVDHAIIRLQSGRSGAQNGSASKTEVPGIYMQQMPYPCFTDKWFAFSMVETMPLFMVISWLFTVAMIIRGIVYEKESRLKEVMHIMGLGNGVHWLAWFITSLAFMMASGVILVIMLKGGLLLERANVLLLCVFMLGVCMATIAQCFLISVFFNKANLAAVCGGFIFFIMYLPYTQLVQMLKTNEMWHYNVACLSPNVAMAMCCFYLSVYEEQMVGAQWENMDVSPVFNDVYCLKNAIVMLYIDTLIYLVLTWYIEAVWPGQYGMPRKPWFFLMPSYWCGASVKKTGTINSGVQGAACGPDMEPEPTDRPVGVSVHNLGKIYSKGDKVALDGLSINFFEGQITSFLGHNGAGKTTTMSILTGLFPPTSGTALIHGLDIHTDFDHIRKSLGMCPQHNVLFDKLSVAEHMWFYALLKGCPRHAVEKEMAQMLDAVGLPHKRDSTADTLSGGMKRKLSVAIAFVGGSKTVILDEPTAGVDPHARRAIWELLLKLKKGRTIIMSTHHMDEADVLGDRVAIISHGRLCAVGSSLFLKERFGSGYYLTLARGDTQDTGKSHHAEGPSTANATDSVSPAMIKLKRTQMESLRTVEEGIALDILTTLTLPSIYETFVEQSSQTIGDQSIPNLTSFIKKFVPHACLVEDKGMEVCYRLPEERGPLSRHNASSERVKDTSFQRLFTALDQAKGDLGVTSYGISDTSLEEVFLKVADGASKTNLMTTVNLDDKTEAGKRHPPPTASLIGRIRQSVARLFKPSIYTTNLIAEDFNMREETQGQQDQEDSVPDLSLGPRLPKISGKMLILHQIIALIIKRFHHVRRSKKSFICEILLPAAFICLAMIASSIVPSFSEDPSLELQPWMYEPRIGSSSLYTFYTSKNKKNKVTQKLEEQLVNMPFYGNRCMNPDKHSIPGKACLFKSNGLWSQPSKVPIKNMSQCDCSSGIQTCPSSIWDFWPPTSKLQTNDWMWNMTGRNLEEWLVKTRTDYESNCYGGFSLGEEMTTAMDKTQMRDVLEEISTALEGKVDTGMSTDEMLKQLEDLIVGGFTANNVKVWFSWRGFMAPVVYLNAMNNAILRSQLPPGKDPRDYAIVTYSHPFKFTTEQFSGQGMYMSGLLDLVVSICVIFAMSFIPASFVIFLIEERVNKSKHLQTLSGVHPITYWLATWIWDCLNYAFAASLCLVIFLAFDKDTYVSPKNLPCLASLLFLYGWAMVPAMYPFAHFFNVPSSAFVLLSCMNVFLGSISTLATFVLDTMGSHNLFAQDLQATNQILKKVFLVFPHYCLGRGMMDMAYYQLQANVYTRYGETLEYSLFEWEICGRNIFCLVIMGFVFHAINLAVELRGSLGQVCRSQAARLGFTKDLDLDADVAKEKERVLSGGAATDMLRVEGLTKMYKKSSSNNSFAAVNNVYFGVPKGQCFGLLGVNGAGKTTSFKMLTGDIDISHGDAFIGQHSVKHNLRAAQSQIGYCPQFDALDPLLTGIEHLQFYARIKGMAPGDVNHLAHLASERLGLSRYESRPAGSYSGGNKRKLATAIALLGGPAVLFLDEPTTGMDPRARRFLWGCINAVVRAGCSVVLTSHSMEECEALCSRLAIMVNGSIKCLGSVQHLKAQFGSGYTVVLRVSGGASGVAAAERFVSATLPAATLTEKHHNMLQYNLSFSGGKDSKLQPVHSEVENHSIENKGQGCDKGQESGQQLGQLFRAMEEAKGRGLLEDFSVSQTTLDQVFVQLAQAQTDLQDNEQMLTNNSNSNQSSFVLEDFTHRPRSRGHDLTRSQGMSLGETGGSRNLNSIYLPDELFSDERSRHVGGTTDFSQFDQLHDNNNSRHLSNTHHNDDMASGVNNLAFSSDSAYDSIGSSSFRNRSINKENNSSGNHMEFVSAEGNGQSGVTYNYPDSSIQQDWVKFDDNPLA